MVIAIIAILASMLLPALSKARAAAQNIKCVNNLKQHGICAIMYVNDNDDRCFEVSGTTWDLPWQDQIAPYLTGGDAWNDYEASSIHKCPIKHVYAYNRIVGEVGFSSFTKSPFMFADSSYYIVSPNGYWGTPGNWWGGSAIFAAHNNSKSVSGDNAVVGNAASTYLSNQAYNNMVFTDGHVAPQRTLDVFGSEHLQVVVASDLWFGGI